MPSALVRVVWWRHTDVAPEALAPCAIWLSDGERVRLQRFRFEKDRVAFLASRILLRQTLGETAGHTPASLRFSTDEHGIKPHLVHPPLAPPLHFSLTHTDDLVACAVTRIGEVGIDAEPWARPIRVTALASRVLSAREAAALDALDPGLRPRRFLDYWTVKEAWLKATGTGLRVAPSSVDVTFTDTPDPAHQAHLSDPEAQRRWQVWRLDASPDHALALVHPRPVTDEPAVTVSVTPFVFRQV